MGNELRIHYIGDIMDADHRESIMKYLDDIGMSEHPVTVFIVDEEHAEQYFLKYFNRGMEDRSVPFQGIKSHRGFCLYHDKIIVMYYTRYETPQSMEWVLMHELSHYAVSRTPLLLQFFALKRDELAVELGCSIEDLYNDDEFINRDDVHERIPEEIFCNQVATTLMGGKCYDRIWWRNHIGIIDGGVYHEI